MADFKIKVNSGGNIEPQTELGVAGETLILGDLCYLNTDGKWWKANSTDVLRCRTELRIAMQTIAPNQQGNFLLYGELYTSNTLTVGTKYYVGEVSGTITNTPSTNPIHFQRYIGTASGLNLLIFNPDATYIKISGDEIDGLEVKLPGTLKNIVEDLTPELGGTLDADGNSIYNVEELGFNGGEVLYWNPKYHTINIPTGDGAVAKASMDTLFDIHNATGDTLLKGTVVYPNGTSTLGVSNVDKAIADTHVTLTAQLGLVAHDILDGEDGHVMVQGVLDPIDTFGLSEGPIYLSSTIAGEFTSVKPDFTSYAVLVGVIDSSAVLGVVTVDIKFNLQNTLTNFWNGVFRESFNFLITSDGSAITGTLTPSNGNVDMTMLFSDGFSLLDTSPSATITLIPGTDTIPQLNYVYIPRSTKVLTVNTSGFPIEEHIKIGTSILQTATTTLTLGVLKNHNFNDHVQSSNGQGHLSHITERLRTFDATWDAGTEASISGLPTNAYVNVTSGVIYQLHTQSFPASSMPTDDIHIVNHFTTPYLKVNDLLTQLNDANGDSLNNSSFSLVIWGVANKTGEPSHVMCNLPISTYSKNTPDLAVADSLGYSVYTIPKDFRGTGFLIARFTFINNGGVWTLHDTQDLRGKLANTSAGGVVGGGAGVTTLLGLTDTPNSYIGSSKFIPRVNVGESAIEFTDDYVDRTTTQSILGIKSFSNLINANGGIDILGTNKARLRTTNNIFEIDDSITSNGLRLNLDTSVVEIDATNTAITNASIQSLITKGWSDANYGSLTDSHTHTNKINLDTINQNLASTDSPLFANVSSNNQAIDNNHLVRLDQMNSAIGGLKWQDSIISQEDFVGVEPSGNAEGDRFINTTTGLSSVTSTSVTVNYIYEWISGAWVEFIPEEGWTLWDEELDTNYTFNGISWVEFGSTISHNNTLGLQGGSAGQYYHLSASEYSNNAYLLDIPSYGEFSWEYNSKAPALLLNYNTTPIVTYENNQVIFAGDIVGNNLSGINTGDVTLGTNQNGLSLTDQVLQLGLASTLTNGALSSTDWNTFNGKQDAGDYAPATSSGNYIQNQNASAQTADFRISGNGEIGGSATIGLTTNNNGARVVINGANVNYNWQIANNWNVGGSIEITPSTLVGGTIFTTPALKIAGSTGAATFASTIQATTAKLTNLTDGYVPYHISDASGLGNSNIFYNGTNVGIGTTEPTERLTLPWSKRVGFTFSDANPTVTNFITKPTTGNSPLTFGATYAPPLTDVIFNFVRNADVSVLSILQNGKLGIGTTSPTEKLDVAGNGLFSGTLTASNLSGTNTGDQVIPDNTDYVDLTTNQTIGGAKTFTESVTTDNFYFGKSLIITEFGQSLTTTYAPGGIARNYATGAQKVINIGLDTSANGRLITFPDADGTLALTSDIPTNTDFVPYTGATANLDLGIFDLQASEIKAGFGTDRGVLKIREGVGQQAGNGYTTITGEEGKITIADIIGGSWYKGITFDYGSLLTNDTYRTYTMPDANGTIALTSDIPTPTYKVYSALISQTGTDAPTLVVLENTIGAIVWTRQGLGTYTATLSGAFTIDKTQTFNNTQNNGQNIHYGWADNYNTGQIQLTTRNSGTLQDALLFNLSIEIRVYI